MKSENYIHGCLQHNRSLTGYIPSLNHKLMKKLKLMLTKFVSSSKVLLSPDLYLGTTSDVEQLSHRDLLAE